jgi:two-component system nitrogen regulation response regulator GlnG
MEKDLPLRELMGPGAAVGRVLADLERVAPTDFTVIVVGETGSGKELVARAIHQQSRRAAAPFVPVDCGAIPPALIESELFGHEKGAFTGADRLRPGKFEAAQGGTLFLDEVQNLPPPVQIKFLRALQERQIVHVGGTQPIDIDIRVIAATNQNLAELVSQGRFRQDLFHRLDEFQIGLPPLRERREDIVYLAKRFLDLTRAELNKDLIGISAPALEALLSYPWPGNVRELRNVIRRAVLLADQYIEREHLGIKEADLAAVAGLPGPAPLDGTVPFKELVRRTLVKLERQILLQALQQTGGNKAQAARLLQIDYKTMHTKAKEYGLKGAADHALVLSTKPRKRGLISRDTPPYSYQ